jgi:hypothetical protein
MAETILRITRNTDACGELVVNNPVEDGCDDANGRYFEGFIE